MKEEAAPMQTTGLPDAIDTSRICITCGKLGGACRWTDDPTICMRAELDRLRAAFRIAGRCAGMTDADIAGTLNHA